MYIYPQRGKMKKKRKTYIYVISRDIGKKRGKISLRFSANEGK